MNTFACAVFASMVAVSMATNGLLVGNTVGLGLGGISPYGYGLGGLAPISTLGLGYNTIGLNRGLIGGSILNRGLVGGTILNRGLVAPGLVAPYGVGINGLGLNGLGYNGLGLGINGLGLRSNSLLLPQSRIIGTPLIGGLSKSVLWK